MKKKIKESNDGTEKPRRFISEISLHKNPRKKNIEKSQDVEWRTANQMALKKFDLIEKIIRRYGGDSKRQQRQPTRPPFDFPSTI